MNNRSGIACRWLLVFCILLLQGLSYEQSPPQPSNFPRPSPRPRPPQRQPPPPLPEGFLQKFPLSLLSVALRLALCPLPESGDCVWQFSWVIDLPPFPLMNGAQSNTNGLHCIGESTTGCQWQSISEYVAAESDTYYFIPMKLHVQAQDISQMLLMGHTTTTGVLLRQLETLSIACDTPLPVFAPYLLEPLIMAVSAARVDFGINVSAVAAHPPPPPLPPLSPGSSPSPNYTSDASDPSKANVGFSRLYAQPTLPSPQLKQLTINNCGLTGQLPPNTFWLQLPNLEHLDLSRNMLSGPLPSTFGPSPPLTYVNLSHNRISGPLMSTHIRYGGCGRTLDLSYNDLRGELPKEWLASACTLKGKESVGLSPPRRRELNEEVDDDWVGPEGGIQKIADLRKGIRAATFKTSNSNTSAASNETNTQASSVNGIDGAISAVSSTTSSTTVSAAYAFWLSYPMSYSYGGDNCPSYGIAWDVSLASGVHNGTGGPDGSLFPFTVLLYGNANLRYPGGKVAGYATAPSAYLHFSVRENACSAFDPLPDLLWLWGSFGGVTVTMVAISVVHGLLVIRKAKAKVSPASAAAGAKAGATSSRARSSLREAASPAPSSGAGGTRTAAAGGGLGGPSLLARDAGGGQQQASGDTGEEAGGGRRKRADPQEGEGNLVRQRDDASRPMPNSPTATATTAGAVSVPTALSTATTTASNTPSRSTAASAAPAVDPILPTARPGSGGMAQIIIVGHHARVYSRAAAQRLSVWGNAVLDGIEAFGEWLFLDVPWGHIIRTLVAFSVQLGAASLAYVMSRPQRTVYCTTVMDCLPYLYFVPIALSVVAMGVTLFLMRATHMLAGSMRQQLASAAAGTDNGSGSVVAASDAGGGEWQSQGSQGPRPTGQQGPSAVAENLFNSSSSRRMRPAAAARATNTAPPAPPAAAVEADAALSEPERWISGLQPIRTPTLAGTTPLRSPSPAGSIARPIIPPSASLPKSSPEGPQPPVAVALPTPRCLSTANNSGGGGTSSRNNNNNNNLSTLSASQAAKLTPDSPRAAAYVTGPRGVVGLGPAGGQTATPVSPSPLGRQGSRPGGPVGEATEDDTAVGIRNNAPVAMHMGGNQFAVMAAAVPSPYATPAAPPQYSSSAAGPAAVAAVNIWPGLGGKGAASDTAAHSTNHRMVAAAAMPSAPSNLNMAGLDPPAATSTVLPSSVSASANSGVMVPGAYPPGSTTPTPTWASQPPGSITESTTRIGMAPIRPGGNLNPWVEDRLNALAVLSSSSLSAAAAAASPTTYSDGGDTRRMPSNAAAAAVAAAAGTTPPRRRQAPPNDNSPSTTTNGTAAQAATAAAAVTRSSGTLDKQPKHLPNSRTPLTNLRQGALAVVNKFLLDYALGSPTTPWWPARVGCVMRSLVLVLLCAVPAAPFAAILVVLALMAVMTETVVRRLGAWGHAMRARYETRQVKPAVASTASATATATKAPRSTPSPAPDCSPGFTWLRLTLALFLGLHTHVAAWVLCIPLAFFTGLCYGLGYMWGQDAVPYPWVFLACNAACLAGVLLLLFELGYNMSAWERGICRYPYEVAVRAAAVGPGLGLGTRTVPRGVEGQGGRDVRGADREV